MAKVKPNYKKQNKVQPSPFNNYWDKNNYLIFGFGFAIIVIGFLLMAQEPWDNPISLTISPLVLLLAYLIVFPLSILYKKKKNHVASDVSSKN